MTIKASVGKGALALGATRLLINLSGMVALVILARMLTPQDFGLVAIGTTVLGIVVALTELSLGSALIQRAELDRAHIDSAWTMAMLRALAITAAFAATAYPLAVVYDDMRLVPVFIVSGATGAMTGLVNPMIALQTRQMRFRPMLVVQFSQKVAGLAVSIALAFWLHNYWAIVAGTAIGTGLATLVSYVQVPYRPRFTLSRARDLMGFSSWLFLGQLMNVLNWRFDQLVIGLYLPKAQLGIYSMADNLSAIPSREAITPLVHALFPGFSRVQGDINRLRRAYLTAQGAIALAALPLAAGLALLAQPIVEVALGAKWLGAVPFVQVISVCYGVQTLVSAVRPLAMAQGMTRSLFYRESAGLALRIPLVLAGLIGWGLTGLVWGRLISAVLGVAISLGMIRNMLGLSLWAQVWSNRRTLAALAVMCMAVAVGDRELVSQHFTPILRIALLVPLGGISFFGSLGLLWVSGGRRAGAEQELIGLLRGALNKGRMARA
ncbi:MAG: hypothetical protein RLZZ08_127 [Pseudomonadota bacterium]